MPEKVYKAGNCRFDVAVGKMCVLLVVQIWWLSNYKRHKSTRLIPIDQSET